MDNYDFLTVLDSPWVNFLKLVDTAIDTDSMDYGSEQKRRKGSIISSPKFPHLPFEIIEEILTQISSPKTLTQFKLVCKSWLYLINDLKFINLHITRQLSSSKLQISNSYGIVLFVRSPIKRTLCTFSTIHSLRKHFSSKSPNNNINIDGLLKKYDYKFIMDGAFRNNQLSTCNGLLFLIRVAFPCNFQLYLCNPALGHRKIVPPSYRRLEPEPGIYMIRKITYGFGYDSTTSDYKVVELKYMLMEKTDNYEIIDVCIYSLAMDSWRRLGRRSLPLGSTPLVSNKNSPFFFNGNLYWRTCNGSSLVAFDLSKEVFKVIMLPSSCCTRIAALGEFCGCLSVVAGDKKKHLVEVWVMKEYGGVNEEGYNWEKRFTIRSPCILCPLGVTSDGKVLLKLKTKKRLKCCDLHRNGAKRPKQMRCNIAVALYDPMSEQVIEYYNCRMNFSELHFLVPHVDSLLPIYASRSSNSIPSNKSLSLAP